MKCARLKERSMRNYAGNLGITKTKREHLSIYPATKDYINGGEGGIRTPGTLIRGTHDFQSCTFNRSVTSPLRNFKDLPGLPHSSNGQCLQNVSMGMSSGWFRKTYHGQKRI